MKTPWYHFWNPTSGYRGGLIFGFTIIVFWLIFVVVTSKLLTSKQLISPPSDEGVETQETKQNNQ